VLDLGRVSMAVYGDLARTLWQNRQSRLRGARHNANQRLALLSPIPIILNLRLCFSTKITP
jgi:hypothetical protein